MTYKLICGDCMDMLPTMEAGSIHVITDPPYGIKRDKGFEGFGGFGKPIARTQYSGEWDNDRPTKIVFDEILRIGRTVIIFGGNFFSDFLPVNGHWIVWDKLNTMPSFGDCELAWTNVKRNSVKKITQEYNGLIGREKQRYHATQKPLKLMLKIILGYTNPGDTILDPFMRSGSTGVACIQTGRNFIGIERDKNYFAIDEKRCHEATLQPDMFIVAEKEKTEQGALL